jgi:hypothetical protein
MDKEHKFKTQIEADKKASSMNRMYGYRPQTFLVKQPSGNKFFVVIEPEGLTRIDITKTKKSGLGLFR